MDESGLYGPADFPVAVFEGAAHWSFSSGPPPSLVAKNDLKPEVDADAAHTLLGGIFADFLSAKIGQSASALAAVKKAVATTADIVAPIIESLVMESFIHIGDACNSDYRMPSECAPYPKYPG